MNNDEIDFAKAEELFDNYLKKCETFIKDFLPPSELKISTITITGNIGSFVNDKLIFNRLKLNDDIKYIEYMDSIKGNKIKKKPHIPQINSQNSRFKTIDKRRKNKGKSFRNQISIGVKGYDNFHKKPVCVKLFKNGGIHMAGCKSYDEGISIYKTIVNNILDIPTKYNIKGASESIDIYPILDIKSIEDANLKIKMINSTFRANFEIDQENLYNELKNEHTNNEIFVTYNRCLSSPVRCYVLKMGIYDKVKKKMKQPSIFIYRSGSINIVVPSLELLDKAYKFINDFLESKYKKIVQVEIKLNPIIKYY